jgi:4-hydroxyproline epimerase
MNTISIIDSHTGGEPTRLIVGGGPALGNGPLAQRVQIFRQEFDHYRSASVCEPRGSDVIVGALDCQPYDSSCAAAVIFFNNAGYLGMCGHGMIGYITSLAFLGRIDVGQHKIETPVGIVHTELHADGSVSVHNVTAYRHAQHVRIAVPGIGTVSGDIAWGGNWFFLIAEHDQELALARVEQLTDFAWRVRQALEQQSIRGRDNAVIDHIELFAPALAAENHSRNFVLCPGKAYDRSPCGTGTSAKLACLAADGKLAPGEIWRQESIIGSVFEASYQVVADGIRPTIRGRAYVNARSELLLDPKDPFVWGLGR